MSSKELASNGAASITQTARYGFDNDQIATIKRTVAKDCTDAETAMLLELAARYELDPFSGEIYAAKMGSRDGAGGSMAIMVGKNGMLKVANREPAFSGLRADTVYKGDSFKVTHGAEGVEVEHSWEVGDAARGKADIIGAWALVYREDRGAPVFFWADFATYNKGKATWAQYPATMIRKVAVANALREAFSLSGLYDEAEMGVVADEAGEDAGEVEIDYGPDENLAEYLKALFEEANRVKPGSFLPQKIRVTLAGKEVGELSQVAIQVEEFVQKAGGTLPNREPVVDAEVVED